MIFAVVHVYCLECYGAGSTELDGVFEDRDAAIEHAAEMINRADDSAQDYVVLEIPTPADSRTPRVTGEVK